ncbi:MAG: FxLYD domain-containing protein [Luteolibacter sp.]
MKAIMKCSNCGAEMSNMNMTWGRKQMWFIIPVMLLGFLPLIKMSFFKGDVTKDLKISDIQTRTSGRSLEIVGLITNSSSREWSGITVEAEFFDASGNFLDEASEYLRSDIGGNSKEHFKITIASPPEGAASGSIKPVVKISGGHTSQF